jgi:hypothetical protein
MFAEILTAGSLITGMTAGAASWLFGLSRARRFDKLAWLCGETAVLDKWLQDYKQRSNDIATDTDPNIPLATPAIEDIATLEDFDTPTAVDAARHDRALTMRMLRVDRSELANCEQFAVNRVLDKSATSAQQLTALRVAELCAKIRHENYVLEQR